MSPVRIALVVDVASVKALRETLAVAQAGIGALFSERGIGNASARHHVLNLQALVDACDVHRPLGRDGKHGDGERCTATCGCDSSETRERLAKALDIPPQVLAPIPATCEHPADAMCPRCDNWPKCPDCKRYHDPAGRCP